MWHKLHTAEQTVSVNETILISRVLLSVKIYLNIDTEFCITWLLWKSYFTGAGFWLD